MKPATSSIGFAMLGSLLFAMTSASIACQAVQAEKSGAPRKPGTALRALPPAATGGDGVQLRTRVDRGAVLRDSDGRVHVQVTLSAADAATGPSARRASDVLVVLDISGSMAGQKLDYAKRALRELVDRLEPGDRFGLVTYESEAEVLLPLQPATDRALKRFRSAIAQLETRGGTNMSAGLDLGLAQLRENRAPGRAARVLLLSDGHANEGDSSPAGLQGRARQVVAADHVLTAMGIGDDFNEDLMSSLADMGAGNFYYLSRVATLGRYFDAELRAATQTVASALELRFEAADSIRVLAASGYPIEQDGNTALVRPGNLYAGQQRTLWFTLAAPTGQTGSVPLGRFVLGYKRDREAQQLRAEPLAALACVTDEALFERAVDVQLWEEFVLADPLNQTELELAKAIAEGDARDVDRIQAGYEQNRDLASKLGASRVIDSFAAVEKRANTVKVQQAAPAAERTLRSKHGKARATFNYRRDAYNDDPLMGLSE